MSETTVIMGYLEQYDRDFDVYVAPSLRVQPVFSRLWDATNTVLRGAGIDTSLSRINAFNAASRRAHQRLGAFAIGWGFFFSAWTLQIALLSSRPWFHVSLSDASTPVLEVSQLASAHRARDLGCALARRD